MFEVLRKLVNEWVILVGNDVTVVYFSSTTENTKRFVDKLGFKSYRVPLRRSDDELLLDEDYVLILPTYGGGVGPNRRNIPVQVMKFLNVQQNRDRCVGVIGSGNTNFGEAYLMGAKKVAEKLNVPLMYGFELMGTKEDVSKVREGLQNFWETIS